MNDQYHEKDAELAVSMFLHGTGKIHWRNTKDQLQLVGPKSLGVALLTAGFVGMVFTIQVRKGHKKP